MSDLAAATADALAATGRFAFVTGRTWDGMEALVAAAAVHAVSPGPNTRLQVATGVGLGGHRAVALIDEVPPGAVQDPQTLALTTSPGCGVQALHAGWRVIQPWTGEDVGPLIDATQQPALVLLPAASQSTSVDPPAPRRTRSWFDGDLTTLIGSGSAVPTMIRLAERLHQRGVDAAAVEIAVLDDAAHEPLVGGAAVLVAGRYTANAFRGETWPATEVNAVRLADVDEADLVGAVLALVPAAT